MLIDCSLNNYQTSSLIRWGLFPGEIKVFVAAPTHLNLDGKYCRGRIDDRICQPYEFRIRGGRELSGRIFSAFIRKGVEYIPVHADTAIRHRNWYLRSSTGIYMRSAHIELIRDSTQAIRGFNIWLDGGHPYVILRLKPEPLAAMLASLPRYADLIPEAAA
jgi:hypothetical protein